MSHPNRSAPSAPIVPMLVYDDAEAAIVFMVRAFGGVERLRMPGPDGRVSHAQLELAGGEIIVGRVGGPFRAPAGASASHIIHVSVGAVDAHCQRARDAGAEILEPPHDMPFGERQYTARDPGGHWWTFSQHIADVDPAAWGARVAQPATDPPGKPSHISG
jgi:uncharacterized glyoxalase superfamily protein PhnB